MQFLETLSQLATEKIQLQIGITVENGTAVISVVPKTKDKLWAPFVLRGTPEELDQEFEATIENFKAALGIISNAATYADQIKAEATKDAEEAKKKAEEAKKKDKAHEQIKAKASGTPAKKEEPKKEEPKAEPKPEKKPEPKPKPPKEPETSDEEDSFELFQ